MIFRYLLHGLLTSVCVLIGLIVTPLNYFVRDFVREHKIVPLWWFLNDTLQYSERDVDWGDFGRFSHNFIGFYQQNAIRNSHWNLRTMVGAHLTGEPYNIIGEMHLLGVRWNYKVGRTFATYYINKVKYFRTSLIKETSEFTFIRSVGKWNAFKFEKYRTKIYIHYQFGTNEYRYIYKIKLGFVDII